MMIINSKAVKGMRIGEWSSGRFYLEITKHIPMEGSAISGLSLELRVPNLIQIRWYQNGFRKVWKAA